VALNGAKPFRLPAVSSNCYFINLLFRQSAQNCFLRGVCVELLMGLELVSQNDICDVISLN
jgi:hypothetical protein